MFRIKERLKQGKQLNLKPYYAFRELYLLLLLGLVE